ncbi:NlpC/P60 family protein [Patescibacteria group bacterium]
MEKLVYENYINIIRRSVDAKMFQNLYCKKEDKIIDVLNNGVLSCAYFVSVILKMFSMINKEHTTVKNTITDMMNSGWGEANINNIKEGDVIIWNKVKYDDGSEHAHIGFYIGNKQAISNSTTERVPSEHHFTYDGEREVDLVMRYSGKNVIA